jgi:hypothetical protein
MGLTSEGETPGVIRVDSPFAGTYLENVTINGALGFAIHQTGGRFACDGLGVNRTDAFSADVGVAVQFDGGADVELKNVNLFANDGGALLLAGPDTEARVTSLYITKTRANAFALEHIQEQIGENPDDIDPELIRPATFAVNVRNGAYLEGRYLSIIGNEYVGLFVHSDGRAVLSDTTISYTSHTTQLPDQSYAHNVVVLDGGSLTMSSFTLSHAQQIGLYLQGDIAVDLLSPEGSPSVISHCSVAVGLGEGVPSGILEHVESSVSFKNNSRNLAAVNLPEPSILPP